MKHRSSNTIPKLWVFLHINPSRVPPTALVLLEGVCLSAGANTCDDTDANAGS